MGNISVSEINIYPVKSLGGIQLDQATLTRQGFEKDRNWMVVTADGNFVTQRQLPIMSTIRVALDDTHLIISSHGKRDLKVALTMQDPAPTPIDVRIHGKNALGISEGRESSEWLTDVLGQYKKQDLYLARFPADYKRLVDPEHLGTRVEYTAFADAYPILVTAEESLAELNRRLKVNGSNSITMDRFRPNIVVQGSEPFAEDMFSELRIGKHVRLELVKPCSRCPITTVDQQTGTKPEPKEPLKTLSQFRKQGEGVMFGQNALVLEGDGQTIQIGEIAMF